MEIDFNHYSDLPWAAQVCYQWNYLSPYDRSLYLAFVIEPWPEL